MLSPLPKSTVISPGIPRNACITRRWTFSFIFTWGSAPHPGSVACGDSCAPRRSLAGEILKELTDRLRAVHVVFLQDLLETLSELRREIIQRFEQRVKKLLCARTGHLSSPRSANR